ncbi:metalloprotease [Butyrivibrio sp. YAB3001]|uniref:metalloprotease n=1 Tax=Butyrivibrio sp. YAB3001 TaxID=1520812 RepID=UPI0008F6448C|nr:M50 family metallopeptidase [Butyrivibrio sp. YAB3001]SFC02061.1 putative peptide zinc metalloprotease protein [Butyrivibrio sp. YAB3001]
MHVGYLEIINGTRPHTYVVKNERTNRYVKLGENETAYLITCLNKIEDFQNDLIDVQYADLLSDDSKTLLDQKFEEWGYFSDDVVETDDDHGYIRKEKGFSDYTKIRIASVNPDRLVQKTPYLIRELFGWKGLLIGFLLTIISWRGVLQEPQIFVDAADKIVRMSWIEIVGLFLAMIITTMLHEFGHGICCMKNGGKIPKMGMMLFFGIPSFYCDVSDIYLMNKRKSTLGVALGGVHVNYLCGTLALGLYSVLHKFGIDIMFLLFYYFANIGFIIFNLIPFVKLDGYWALAAMIGIDNLMDKGVIFFLTCIFDHGIIKEKICSIKKGLVLSIYGLGAIMVYPMFWVATVKMVYNYLYLNNLYVPFYIITIMMSFIIAKDILNMFKRYQKIYLEERRRILRMV